MGTSDWDRQWGQVTGTDGLVRETGDGDRWLGQLTGAGDRVTLTGDR
jgi:hypothetical protein